MCGGKPYFCFLVKDDLQRFFYQVGLLSTLSVKTRDWRVHTGDCSVLVAQKGFPLNGHFQRYPNILVTKNKSYQQLKQKPKHDFPEIN